MSERISVPCTCGYETLVPPEQLGQTIECIMCGADLEVDEAASTARREIDDPIDSCERGDAPESPLVGESGRHVSDPESTFEEADAAERESAARRNPFEDEPESAGQGALKDAAPGPGAASLFEDDDEEAPVETGREGPFTLDAAPESRAATTSFASLMEETRPRNFKSGPAHVETESPSDRPTGEQCSECGRQIRGAWDRFALNDGVICYICSNQGTSDIPLRLKEGAQPPRRELQEDDLLVEMRRETEPEEAGPPWYFDTESPEFKRAVLILAVGTIGFASFVYLFGGGSKIPAPTPAGSEVVGSGNDSSPTGIVLRHLWAVLAVFASGAMATYIALRIDDNLPQGRIVADVLYTGAVWIPLAVMYLITGVMAAVFAPIAVIGPVVAVLLALGRWLVVIVVLSRFLDMRAGNLMAAAVLYAAFRWVVFAPLGAALLAN